MDVKQLWESFNWIHWKGWHNSFIAKYQHLHYSVICTTLLFLSIAFDSNFFPEELASCLLTETPTPLNHFSCSFPLVFSLGLICHKESTFLPIHENYTKWVRVMPRTFWHPDPEWWVGWPPWAANRPGTTYQLCCRRLRPPPHKTAHCCISWGLVVASAVHKTFPVSFQTLPLESHVTDFALWEEVVVPLLGKYFKSQCPLSHAIFLLPQWL